MSGRLVILPKKSWHVWSPENIERVRRDEAKARGLAEEVKEEPHTRGGLVRLFEKEEIEEARKEPLATNKLKHQAAPWYASPRVDAAKSVKRRRIEDPMYPFFQEASGTKGAAHDEYHVRSRKRKKSTADLAIRRHHNYTDDDVNEKGRKKKKKQHTKKKKHSRHR